MADADDAYDASKAGASRFPDFKEQREQLETFLREFEADLPEEDGEAGEEGEGGGARRRRRRHKKYGAMLQEVANRTRSEVVVEMDDLLEWLEGRGEDADPASPSSLVANVLGNTHRYIEMLSDAVDALLPPPNVELPPPDVIDILHEQRVNIAAQAQGDASLEEAKKSFPKQLLRRWELTVRPPSSQKVTPLREIRAAQVGALVRVSGIVTRLSDVQPLQRVAAYTCDTCGYEIYQPVESAQFTPLDKCESEQCKENQQAGELHPQTRGSKFVKYQDMRLQEMPGEVPVGNIPRTLSVRILGDRTRTCLPGDIITLSGVFLVKRYTGFRAIRAGLTADTYLEAQDIQVHKKSYADMRLSEELLERVERASREPAAYDKLAKSLAPEIYGHVDVKKALLLLLAGGVSRDMGDLRIRGDINVLLSGDPGVAKSQLLKHITKVAPRGVYTTGKGSSGVGLTAAVLRDQQTGEMTLEGGALVLADKGICCIDEFDKMEESDRTAIHEVMEQQTVSIAKAGITTTLNARTSVLAAANPVWGRYNLRKTPEENIGLPAALLSRFDLTFILRDVPDEQSDTSLAKHITTVHMTSKHPPLEFEPYDPTFIRAYVARARQCDPVVPRALTDFLVGTYVQMRAENKEDGSRQRFCTARSLLSVLRLAQGVARLRFADEVTESDVTEASRLLYVAKANLEGGDDDRSSSGARSKRRQDRDSITKVWNLLKAHVERTRKSMFRRDAILNKLAAKGLTEEDLDQTLEEYKRLNLVQVAGDSIKLIT